MVEKIKKYQYIYRVYGYTRKKAVGTGKNEAQG